MIIASLYPVVEAQYESVSTFDWHFIRELQQNFGGFPHDYHVFLPHGNNSPDPMSIGDNVHIKNTTELIDFFQEFQVDVWHDFGYTSAADLVSLRQLSKQYFPITINVQLPFLANAQLTTYDALSNSDALICSTPSIHKLIDAAQSHLKQSVMQQHTYPRICTIPHGVMPVQVDSDKKQDARHLLQLPKEYTIILCIADFNPNSSIDIVPLIRAFQVVAENKEDVILILTGSDQEGYVARVAYYFIESSSISRQVMFLPNVDESAKSLLLAATDIFISPSDPIYIDNGLQILDAMARGIPVIATDGDKGHIEHGKTGFKLEKGGLPLSYQALRHCYAFLPHRIQSLALSQGVTIDVQQIIQYLTLLVEDTSLRKTIGDAAFKYVSQHHHPTNIVKEYNNLWSNLREDDSIMQLKTTVTDSPVSDNSWLPLLTSLLSQTIDENTPLHITPDGEIILETKNVIVYDELKEMILATVILEILKLAQSVTSISNIADSLLGVLNPDEAKELVPNVAYHVIWSIKQGLILPQKNSPIQQN